MAWMDVLNGTKHTARIIALIILKIVMFIFTLAFMAIKFTFFAIVFMLTLGRIGMSTMDLGGKRRWNKHDIH